MQLEQNELSIIAAALDFYLHKGNIKGDYRAKVEAVADHVVKNQEADQDEE